MTAAPGRRRARALLVPGALALIAAATLVPQAGESNPEPWYSLLHGDVDLADAILNVGLFVPLGIALAAAGASRRRAVLVALATTIAVELLQGVVIPGRQASLGDVLSNTLGAWLGHRGALLVPAAWRARTAAARRAAMAYGAAWLAATLLTASLLGPALPATGQRATCGPGPRLPDCFSGFLAPTLLRQPGTMDVLLDEDRPAVVGRRPTLAVEVVSGRRLARAGQVTGVVDAEGDDLLILEQRWDWLVFLVRTRGGSVGLRTPAVALPGVFLPPLTPASIRAGVDGNVRWLEVGDRRAELRLSAAEGWRLFFPWSAATDDIIRAVGALLHAICLVPLGFFAARAVDGRRRAAAGALAAVPVVLAFAGGAPLLDLAPTAAWDWLGAAAGLASGFGIGAATARPDVEASPAGADDPPRPSIAYGT